MNGLNSLGKTDSEYSIAATDDLIRGQRLRSQQAVEVKSCEHHTSRFESNLDDTQRK